MTIASASWSRLRVACVAIAAVACHDAVAPEPAPPPDVQSFYAEMEEDWATIDVAFSASSARGVRYVHIDSPERGVTLLDTILPDAPRQVSQILRITAPPHLILWWTNDVPLRLVVEDAGGFRGLELHTVAHEAAPRAYGSVAGFDYNPYVLRGDTLRVSAGGNALVPVAWVGMLVGAPISTADSVPAANTFSNPVYMGSSGLARWKLVVDDRWTQPDGFGEVGIGFMTRDIFGRYDEWRYAVDKRVIPARRVAPGLRLRLPDYVGITTVVPDERRGVAYVVWSSRAEIGVLDLATMRFRAPIALSGIPGWPAFSVSGDSLIIPNRSRPVVEIVDLAHGTRSEIPIADTGNYETPRTPWSVTETANGHLLVAVGLTPDSFAWLVDVDLATGEQHRRTDVGENGLLGGSCARLASTPDHRRAVVVWEERSGRRASAVYDAATGRFSDSRNFDGLCGGPLELIGDGDRLLVGNQVVDRNTGAVTLLQAAPGVNDFGPFECFTRDRSPACPSDLRADGRTALMATDYGFAIARTSDGVIIDRVLTPVPELGFPCTPRIVRALEGENAALVVTSMEAILLHLR